MTPLSSLDVSSIREGDRVRYYDVPVPSVDRGASRSSRTVVVVLPVGYRGSPHRRYPTVYLLHGFGHNSAGPAFWFGRGYAPDVDILSATDRAGSRRLADSMIFVCPDGGNRLGGTMWEDSRESGAIQSWLVDVLPPFIDRELRTVSHPQSRGIAGHSMGGQGAMKVALKRPDVFGSVYSMSGMMAFCEPELRRYGKRWFEFGAPTPGEIDAQTDESVAAYVAMSAAFCWRVRGLNEFVHPMRSDGSLCLVSARAFFQEWPLNFARTHPVGLRKLKWIGFDVGLFDEFSWGLESNRMLVQLLRDLGVQFIYEEYRGTHSSGIADRLRTRLIPFFSRAFGVDDVAYRSRDDLQHEPKSRTPL